MCSKNSALPVVKHRASYFESKLQSLLLHNYKNVIAIMIERRLVLIFSNYSAEAVEESMKKIKKEVSFYSVGNSIKDICNLHKSYRQALQLVKLEKRNDAPGDVIYYKNVGIMKLLMEIEDKEVTYTFFFTFGLIILKIVRLKINNLNQKTACTSLVNSLIKISEN